MKIITLFQFGKSLEGLDELISDKENEVVSIIKPIEDQWNDFGYKIRCDFKILKPKKFKAVMYFAIKTKAPFDTELVKEFIDLNDYFASFKKNRDYLKDLDPERHEYFSIFTDMQVYRDLLRIFKVETVNNILRKLNDLIYLKAEIKSDKQISKYSDSKIFDLAFMRNHESLYMFHNADQVLNSSDLNNYSNISEKFFLNYQLFGRSGQNKLSLEFDSNSILPKRINVLIGKNGLGKSRALYTVANSLINRNMQFKTHHNDEPVLNNLLAIGTPGETESSFPKPIVNPKIRYKRVIMGRYSQSKTTYRLGDLIKQIIRSEDYVGDISRWDLFLETVRQLEISDPLIVQLKRDSLSNCFATIDFGVAKYLKLDKKILRLNEKTLLQILSSISNQPKFKTLTDGKPVPLSSGQSAFLKFAIQASLFIEEGTLVLIDEPETHLHPNYISLFVSLLDRILKDTKSIAIIATHSAYIVREIPRTQVHVFLENEDNSILISNPRRPTFGANINSISEYVFNDGIRSNLTSKLVDNLNKLNKRKREEVVCELEDELPIETMMYINRMINRD